MKKTALLILLTTMAISASAQTMYDALRFSENYYEGTARTMAMGNAFTALGGDLGAVNINPAGSAVARYSQITISPGISITSNIASGYGTADAPAYAFNYMMRNKNTEFNLPNIGFSINFDTHRKSGIKNIALGFTSNMSNTYNNNMYASGSYNDVNSFMGALAVEATEYGYANEELLNSDAWFDSSAPWELIAASQGGLIADIAEALPRNEFVAASENFTIDEETGRINIHQAGALEQSYGRAIIGSKRDMVFNFAMNISDMVFVGANFGITTTSLSKEKYIIEESLEPSLFYNEFAKMKYSSMYNAVANGIYGKFGIIVTPVAGLRLGAAIQTPTAMSINESWNVEAYTQYLNHEAGRVNALSPEGKYEYKLTSPMRFNVGAAYSFGKFAVVSADYEMSNYKSMYFKEKYTSDNSSFDNSNSDIRKYMGNSHLLRLGAEIKPVRQLAVRAGFGFTTSPEKQYNEREVLSYTGAMSKQYSFGIGYISDKSFFFDLGCMLRRYNELIHPYNMTEEMLPLNIASPIVENQVSLWTVAATFGFRF